jgi:hypothetical protein
LLKRSGLGPLGPLEHPPPDDQLGSVARGASDDGDVAVDTVVPDVGISLRVRTLKMDHAIKRDIGALANPQGAEESNVPPMDLAVSFHSMERSDGDDDDDDNDDDDVGPTCSLAHTRPHSIVSGCTKAANIDCSNGDDDFRWSLNDIISHLVDRCPWRLTTIAHEAIKRMSEDQIIMVYCSRVSMVMAMLEAINTVTIITKTPMPRNTVVVLSSDAACSTFDSLLHRRGFSSGVSVVPSSNAPSIPTTLPETRIMLTTDVGKEGMDCPKIGTLILACPVGRGSITQLVGRTMRRYGPSKTHGEFIDINDTNLCGLASGL